MLNAAALRSPIAPSTFKSRSRPNEQTGDDSSYAIIYSGLVRKIELAGTLDIRELMGIDFMLIVEPELGVILKIESDGSTIKSKMLRLFVTNRSTLSRTEITSKIGRPTPGTRPTSSDAVAIDSTAGRGKSATRDTTSCASEIPSFKLREFTVTRDGASDTKTLSEVCRKLRQARATRRPTALTNDSETDLRD